METFLLYFFILCCYMRRLYRCPCMYRCRSRDMHRYSMYIYNIYTECIVYVCDIYNRVYILYMCMYDVCLSWLCVLYFCILCVVCIFSVLHKLFIYLIFYPKSSLYLSSGGSWWTTWPCRTPAPTVRLTYALWRLMRS